MIRHPGIFVRLYAAAGRGSVTGWRPYGLVGPERAAHQGEGEWAGPLDDTEPPRESWQRDWEHEHMVRKWRERQQAKGTV